MLACDWRFHGALGFWQRPRSNEAEPSTVVHQCILKRYVFKLFGILYQLEIAASVPSPVHPDELRWLLFEKAGYGRGVLS